jgi:hypothetical protein
MGERSRILNTKQHNDIDHDLLAKAERIRYQSDFSSAHWLHQVISIYTELRAGKVRDEYAKVIRIAINNGIKEAISYAEKLPSCLGFPGYLFLRNKGWRKVRTTILDENNWNIHLQNRFGHLYRHEGD